VYVLRLEPDRLNARRELAHTLMLAHRYKASEYYFRQLLKIDGNREMRAGYQSFLARIDRKKPAGISMQISFLPSTNINQGTTNKTLNTTLGKFTINPSSKPSSGIGVQLGISGFYRQGLSQQSRLDLEWGITGIVYSKKSFNNVTGSISASYQQVTHSGKWSVTPYVRHSWRQDNGGYDTFGIGIGAERSISAKNRISLGLTHEFRRFPYLGFENGIFNRATINVQHQIAPSLSISAGVGAEESLPHADYLKYSGHDISLGINKQWDGGLFTGVNITVGNRDFVGNFPLTLRSRKDRFLKTSLTIYNTRLTFKGITPKLTCTDLQSRSNIAFYTFSATQCALSGQIVF